MFFGGFHYIYTRLLADLMYTKQNRTAASLLVLFSVVIGGVSALGSLLFFSLLDLQLAHPLLFRLSGCLLFASVNVVWLLMLFISLVSQYGKILISYSLGMAVAIGSMFLLGKVYLVAGALLGFALGHVLIVLLLFMVAFRAYAPKGFTDGAHLIVPYIKRYRSLFFTGYFYYIALWIDKVIFWFTVGTPIAGTVLHLYEPYDIAVYICTLTMIPGLVYFFIFSEPNFYIYVKKFLLSLNKTQLRTIRRKKYLMFTHMKNNLREQSVFQAVVTVCCVILVPVFVAFFPTILTSTTMIITLAAVFFHLLLLTSINLLFYLEFYHYTCRSALLFCVINGATALLIAFLELYAWVGINYLIAAAAAAMFALFSLFREGKKADRYILAGIKVM
jgi:uncharacterized membrane protein